MCASFKRVDKTLDTSSMSLLKINSHSPSCDRSRAARSNETLLFHVPLCDSEYEYDDDHISTLEC